MLIILISYILLNLIAGIVFILFLLVGIFISQKLSFLQHKNNDEWNLSLIEKKGFKVKLILLYSYLLSIVVILPLSYYWFTLIGVNHTKLATLLVWGVISIIMKLKLPKLKMIVQDKYETYYAKEGEVSE